MDLVDRYAYCCRVRSVDPLQKAAVALLALALCLVLDRPAVGLATAGWMWLLASGWAGLPARAFGKVLLAEVMVLLPAVAGIALGPSPGEGALAWQGGPFWLGLSTASLETALRTGARALGAGAAMGFLALTTPMLALLDAMRRLGVPSLLIDLMALVYRFLFVLLDSLARIRTAQDCRLGYAGWRRGMASVGILAGRLLADVWRRSRRLETALESRGYRGELRVLPGRYRQDGRLPWLGAGLTATLLLVRVAA